MKNYILLFTLLILLSACSKPAQDIPVVIQTEFSGGSNLAFYKSVDGEFPGAYGILKNWRYSPDGVNYPIQSIVSQQLSDMYAAGQRYLRVPVWFTSDDVTLSEQPTAGEDAQGYFLNAANGTVGIYAEQLQEILEMIKAKGFREVIVAFMPLGPNTPFDKRYWGTWNDELFQINWNVIYTTRPYIINAGIPYKIDLMNEGAPIIGYDSEWLYTANMWSNYNRLYGKADTIGVSFGLPVDAEQVRYIMSAYDSTGYGRPDMYDVHVYDSIYDRLSIFDSAMDDVGESDKHFILGETWYNDPSAIAQIKSASATRNRYIEYILQWPMTSDNRWISPTINISLE